ncbi:MAG: hypothetical protein J6Q34_02915 [Bacteroidales bacterium]|nr:hypothetical protein [Bacteroidales bacterium]
MKLIKYLFASFVLLFSVASCDPVSQDPPQFTEQQKTLLVYMVANNNLSSNATGNINAMLQGYLPTEDNLLVYLHSTNSNPILLRLYRDERGAAAKDTVYRFPQRNSADPASLTSAMNVCRTMYPAQEYGLVLWSHGTGWLPKQYYGKTRSFGQDAGNEMDIIEMAKAIPFKLNYVIFDACLMGGIEVAYELKDSVDYVIASPTEIFSDGFPYRKMMEHIFKSSTQLQAVAQEYYNHYNDKSGSSRSATIALIKTSELDNVAQKAKDIFNKYGHNGNLDNTLVDTTAIQKYYRDQKHWFYDLGGLVQQLAGDDADAFNKALESAVIYKAATPEFISVKIDPAKFSGLSTYIPSSKADAELLEYYTKLRWNRDTGYIQTEEKQE